MKVAVYSRKSKVTNKGESMQNQIDLCIEYMNQNFLVNEFIIYEDEGFSGGTSDRPKYKRMLLDAKAGHFSTLICYRLDRISRNICDFSETIETLNSLNIAFISLREQFDTSTPMGRAMMYIASVFSQLERETIAERIKDNMLSLARTGRWLGGNPPTGYVSKAIEYYDKELNKKTMYGLKQIPEEIVVVKKLFEQYLKLGSLNQVEIWAMERNIRTRNGNVFDITGIRAILTNMVYVIADASIFEYCKNLDMDIASDISEFNGNFGLMVYNKNIIKKGQSNKLRSTSEWIVSVGKHEGIISSNIFFKVQENIKINKLKAPKTVKSNTYLLGPILKCQNCGSSLRTTYGNKRKDASRLYYYKCILKEKSRGKKCNTRNLNGKDTDIDILEYLKTLDISYKDLYSLLKEARSDTIFMNSMNQDSKSRIKKDISKHKSMIFQLTSSLSVTRDSVSSKYIIAQIEDLDKKIVACQDHLDNIIIKEHLSKEDHMTIDFLKDIIIDFPSALDKLTHNEKKHIIDTVIKSILWDGDSIKVLFY